MTLPYALTARAPKEDGYALAEALGFDSQSDALSVSIFDDGPDWVHVQAFYETLTEAEIAQANLPSELEISIAQLPDEDWVGLSQSGLPPIEAGRFIVHGSHDEPKLDGKIPILVDAGQAFGTGHHGTTKACLLMLDQLHSKGLQPGSVLDLGTGAGILAIAAAKLWPDRDIIATDIDPVAVEVARENAKLNRVTYDAFTADGFQSSELSGRQFDLIIANILAGPLRDLAKPIAEALPAGGTAILSGILDEQALWVAEAFEACGLSVDAQPSLNGWTSLLATKP